MMSAKSNIKFLCLLFILALVLPINCETKYNLGFWDFSNWFNFNKKNDQDSSSSLVSTHCVGCSNKLDDGSTIQDELTLLRIEYIKQQILKKLRLKEKPTVTLPIAGLPKPVTENKNLFPRDQDAYENDHYYGKTTQAIIFPTEGKYIFFIMFYLLNFFYCIYIKNYLYLIYLFNLIYLINLFI